MHMHMVLILNIDHCLESIERRGQFYKSQVVLKELVIYDAKSYQLEQKIGARPIQLFVAGLG